MQEAVQRAISTAIDDVEDHGLILAVSQNAAKHKSFANELKQGDQSFPISTILDDDYCHLESKKFFWISLRNERGVPIASVAARAIEGDLLELIRTGRLWGNRRPVQVPSTQFFYPAEAPALNGKSVYTGGLYIRPDYRNTGLAKALSRLIIGFSDRLWHPDWQFCMQFPWTWRPAKRLFGFDECYLVLKDAARPGLAPRDLWLCLRSGRARQSVEYDQGPSAFVAAE